MDDKLQRLTDNVTRGKSVQVVIDGQEIQAFEGETLAAAMLAAGRRVLRHTQSGAPRGIFCGIGVCFDCTVSISGVGNVRACVTPVRDGMDIRTDMLPQSQ